MGKEQGAWLSMKKTVTLSLVALSLTLLSVSINPSWASHTDTGFTDPSEITDPVGDTYWGDATAFPHHDIVSARVVRVNDTHIRFEMQLAGDVPEDPGYYLAYIWRLDTDLNISSGQRYHQVGGDLGLRVWYNTDISGWLWDLGPCAEGMCWATDWGPSPFVSGNNVSLTLAFSDIGFHSRFNWDIHIASHTLEGDSLPGDVAPNSGHGSWGVAWVRIDPNGGRVTADGTDITEPTVFPWPPESIHTLSADSGYSPTPGTRLIFLRWSDEVTDNPRNFVASKIEVSVSWNREHFLETSSIYGSPTGQGWYEEGSVATISVEPMVDHGNGTRHVFVGWTGDVESTETTIRVLMDGPKTVKANWKTQYLLSVQSLYGNPQGTGWYDRGVEASFSVDSPVDHGNLTRVVFMRWTGDSSETSTSATIVMNGPRNVFAIWKKQYFVTAISQYSEARGEGWHDEGSTAMVSVDDMVPIEEGTRAVFIGWAGDMISGDPSVSLVVDSPKMFTVNWKIQHFLTIEKSPPRGVLDQSSDWFDEGTTLTITAEDILEIVPGQTRLVFTGWTGAVSSSEQVITVVIDSPKTLDAVWKTQHFLQVNVSPSGIAAVAGEGWYDEGATATTGSAQAVIEKGKTRYIFDAWTLDGVVKAGNPATMVMDSPHVVVATFEKQHYLTVESELGDPQGEGWYTEGSTATFSVTSSIGFLIQEVFTGWSGDSTSTSPTAMVMMNSPKTVTASWRTDYTQLLIIAGVVVAAGAVSALALRRKKKTSTDEGVKQQVS